MNRYVFMIVGIILSQASYAQTIKLDSNRLEAVHVSMSIEKLRGEKVVKVVKDTAVKKPDEPTFVKIKDIDFTDGTIEVKVLSRLLKNAPALARGFIGMTFRINKDNSQFEGIYLRPTNARAEDQLRRNRSIQYFSYPDFTFEDSRRLSPGIYESYADMQLDEWITMRIEVKGQQARLFINNSNQPSLIVNDLKHGQGKGGAIGLWVDIGTEGFFKDLHVYYKQ